MRLKVVAKGVNELRSEDNAFIVITHYQRLLEYIVPDFVHVIYDGTNRKIRRQRSWHLSWKKKDTIGLLKR